jgi:hypothetical protein
MNTLPHSTGSIPSCAFPSIPADSATKFTTLAGRIQYKGIGTACAGFRRVYRVVDI